MEVVASLSQCRTAASQCGLFTHKSVLVIFEPRCISVDVINLAVHFVSEIHDRTQFNWNTCQCSQYVSKPDWLNKALLVSLMCI